MTSVTGASACPLPSPSSGPEAVELEEVRLDDAVGRVEQDMGGDLCACTLLRWWIGAAQLPTARPGVSKRRGIYEDREIVAVDDQRCSARRACGPGFVDARAGGQVGGRVV